MTKQYTYRAIDENQYLVECNGTRIGIYHSAEQAQHIIRNAEKLDKRYAKKNAHVHPVFETILNGFEKNK